MRLTISRADTSDASALTSLRVAVARDMTARFGRGPWSTLPSRAVVLRQIRASHALVARRGGEVVGSVRLAFADPAVFDTRAFAPVGPALYVLGLAVSPSARRHGIGGAIMSAAKEIARAWPAQALWLDTFDHAAGAAGFYRKCGFRAVGRGEVDGLPLLFFEWLVRMTGPATMA